MHEKVQSLGIFFFCKSIGITEPEKALNDIYAIIKEYDLPYDRLPQGSGMNSNFLYKILEEASKKNDAGSNVIVVIDALDEAESLSAGSNWLHLPDRSLPKSSSSQPTSRGISHLNIPGDFKNGIKN